MVVPDVSTNECPVSLITPESIVVLEIINRNRHVRESSGASILGLDASRLPARLVDAIELVEIERVKLQNLKDEEDEEALRKQAQRTADG